MIDSADMPQTRIGIIGQGIEADLHEKAWRSVTAAQVIRIFPAPASPSSHAREFELMFHTAKPGAVSLCGPPQTRRAVATWCLDHDVSVLCELPLAHDVDSTLSLLQSADKPRPVLAPANKFRFLPDVQLTRGILGGGGLGDVRSFEIALPPPHTRAEVNGGGLSASGLVFEQGFAAFDLATYLFGLPQLVTARSGSDAVVVRLQYAAGLEGRVEFIQSAPAIQRGRFLTVTGTEGSIELGWQESLYRPSGQPVARISTGVDMVEACRRMISLFCGVAEGDARPWTTPAGCRNVIGMVQCAQQSLELDRATEVPAAAHRLAA